MVLLRSLLVVFGLLLCALAQAEPLDTLLTNLAAPKPMVAPEPEPIEPEIEPKVAPLFPKVAQEPDVAVEPKEPAPEFPKIAPMVEPIEQPKAPSVIAQPIFPKVAVSPVLPKIEPIVEAPGVVAAPGLPKIVGAPKPVIATTDEQVVGDAKVQMKITDVHEISQEGLNTLNVDTGGNWLEKRIWYKKAEQLFEIIRGATQKAGDVRMKFVHEVNQVGQQIDEFYESVSVQKGQIEELLQAVSTELTTEQKIRGGDLSSEERSVRLKIQADQQQLQSVAADFKLIEDLDDQIDKTMMKAFKEIDSCRALETKAWNNFKEIGMELDDKKARVLYYEMENFHKNIEQKMTYLQSNLLQYLQGQLVGKVSQTTNQIKTTIQTLNNKGTQLQALLQKDQNGDFVILQQRDNAKAQQEEQAKSQAVAKDSQAPEHQEAAKKKKAANESWYVRLVDVLVCYACAITTKLSEWGMITLCCIQTIMCKAQQLICKLLGY